MFPERLKLTKEEQIEAASWDLPHEEAWQARVKEEKDFVKLLKVLEGSYEPSQKEIDLLKTPAKSMAAVNGLLITRREQKLSGETKLAAVVPFELRAQKISDAHERKHKSIKQTITDMRNAHMWWPGMRADITAYVRSCVWCAMVAAGTKGKGLWIGWG
jgi:hypothetical protein